MNKMKKRSPFKWIYRVYEDNIRNNITFEIPEKIQKAVHSLCNGVVQQRGYDKVNGGYVVIYSKEENKFYFYYNITEVEFLVIGEEVEIGDIIGNSDKVCVKIYEKCPCSTIFFYYSYLEIYDRNNQIITRDGIYYNGG